MAGCPPLLALFRLECNGFLGLSTQTSTTTGTGTSGAFAVSGTITGLTASGLVLYNGVDELTLSDGATNFAFPTLFVNR